MNEIIDNKGDVWSVETCEAEDGCVVIRRWLTRYPSSEIALANKPSPANSIDWHGHEEPTDEVHVPSDVMAWLLSALAATGRSPEGGE